MALASNRYAESTGVQGMNLSEARAFARRKVAAVRERQQPLAEQRTAAVADRLQKVLAAFEVCGVGAMCFRFSCSGEMAMGARECGSDVCVCQLRE